MHVCMYVCIYVCVYVCVCRCVCIYKGSVNVCMVCPSSSELISLDARMTDVRSVKLMIACVYVYLCVYINMYIYIHTQRDPQRKVDVCIV